MECWAIRTRMLLVGLLGLVLSGRCLAASQRAAEYDKIVDDFIQYDIGRLPGQAGMVANQRFMALQGNEAIRALCRGANKAARLTASCPIIVISNKLQQLLAECRDEKTLRYVMENLEVSATGLPYGDWLKNLRAAVAARLGNRARDLDTEVVELRGMTSAELRVRRMARKPLDTWHYEDLVQAVSIFRGPALVQILEEISRRKGSEYTDALADAVAKVPEDTRSAVRGLLANRLTRMTDTTLRAKLTEDSRPEVRAATAVAIGYKGSPLYRELAVAIRDRNLQVATGAHSVLVKMLGVDQGPAAGASTTDWYVASKAWEEWIDKNRPGRPVEGQPAGP